VNYQHAKGARRPGFIATVGPGGTFFHRHSPLISLAALNPTTHSTSSVPVNAKRFIFVGVSPDG
jgi:hypothetical protein